MIFMSNLKKPLKTVILLGLLVASMTFTGCKTTIHAVSGQDIVLMKAGKSHTPDRDGYFLSNEYLKRVAKTKIDEAQ